MFFSYIRSAYARLSVIVALGVVTWQLPLYANEAAKISHDLRKDALFTRAGDALQYVIPAGALGYSLITKDYDGIKGWCLSVGSAVILTQGLKYAVDRPRPYQEIDERGGHSFPSGHTAFAFVGAAYWQRRYGWEVGVPAYLLAATTGYSRVWSKYHYWSDVATGAAIGALFPYIFTKPYKAAQVDVSIDPLYGTYISYTFLF